MSSSSAVLQFVPFSSCINPSFWHKFANLKLNTIKLDESAAKVWGYYSNLNPHIKPILEVDSTSFNSEYNGLKFYVPYHGLLFNKNTIEQFKECDKLLIIKSVGNILENNIKMGHAIDNPSLLNVFLILSHADLKKYNFYYWFAFPVSTIVKPIISNSYGVIHFFNIDELSIVQKQFLELNANDKAFFLLKFGKNIELLPLRNRIKLNHDLTNLNDYENLLFAFSDSTSQSYPGWPLRNFILLLLYHCPMLHGKTLKFLSLRLYRKGCEIKCDESIVWEIKVPEINIENIFPGNTENNWSGYELNERDKMGPRISKMKDSMSPVSLADASVDLNLKLMKWRLLPDIDLDKLKMMKCLLLGAGTLGCAVARNLLAWGVRTITFVDNGSVSYSNPVRQSLFTFEDCVSNKHKATAASENLSKIFPGVTTSGHNFQIPMPGHPCTGETLLPQTQEACKKLHQLIEEHDVIFLLTDSRESRWLPTLICASLGKIAINAALGFDTYLVMRHGIKNNINDEIILNISPNLKCIPGNRLGCYFCNDITAPGDSLTDRTLDQQCTVTRPGVSNIAASLAVELAVSVVQHDKGALAPAFYTIKQDDDISRENECVLGIVPHSIRGFLSMFNHVLPATERYNQCIACSDIVVKSYEEQKFDFLMQVFNNSSYLEEVTGLDKMFMDCGKLEDLNLSEDDSA